MDSLQLKMCDIQGRLFELSADQSLDSASFISAFMKSDAARHLDSKYNRLQWAGEEYLLEELLDEKGAEIMKSKSQYSREMLFWIGYLYRYWHYYTGESSRSIYKQAPVNTMKKNYMMFHTFDPQIAVDDLKEIHKQRSPQNRSPYGSIGNRVHSESKEGRSLS